MKTKLNFQPLAAMLVCVLLFGMIFLPQTARAAGPDDNTLTLSYAPNEQPAANVTFRLYRVAEVDQDTLSVSPVKPYDSYNVLSADTDWATRASTLAGYVRRDKLTETASAVTDEDGRLTLTGLEDGMYLITGSNIVRNGYIYSPVPALLCLPYFTEEHIWINDVAAAVKVGQTPYQPGGDSVERHVLKVWDDAGNEEARPESVTVELLGDGVVYDTVVLSAANNWRHTWTGLDGGVQWQLTEQDPGSYEVAVTEGGITFVVTNTYAVNIDDPDIPLTDLPDDGTIDIDDPDVPMGDLPQTGQLWWPVPVLALSGMLLLVLGIARRRRSV